ncbi:MAG: hypothetical protein Q9183_002480, partial [Haloplaca sp. 2 TL-2023]
TNAARRCGLSRSHRKAIPTEKPTDTSACIDVVKTPTTGDSHESSLGKHNPRLQDGDNNFTDRGRVEDSATKLVRLAEQKATIDTSIEVLNTQIEKHLHSRHQEDMQEGLLQHKILREDITVLKGVLEEYGSSNPQWLERRRAEIDIQKSQAEKWTNNVEVLMDWMGKASGDDKQRILYLQQYYYGTEFVEGEGLRAL